MVYYGSLLGIKDCVHNKDSHRPFCQKFTPAQAPTHRLRYTVIN